jgi:nucleotide-binding universal stress UspA family protein
MAKYSMQFELDIRHGEIELRRRVISALQRIPESSHIGVSVANEVVTLEGCVQSLDVLRLAEEMASAVEGVSSVVNDLRLDAVSWVQPLVEHVVVPVDLSDQRVGALRYAHLFAHKLGSRVTVLYADPLAPRPGQETPYTERLDRMVRMYADPHLDPWPFDVALWRGDPATVILQHTPGDRGMIVMGTSARERDGHVASRSVAMAVVRGASCPVLTIDGDDYPPVHRGVGVTAIVCPVNLSAVARRAVEFAAKLAEVFHAHLFVVRVVEPDEHTELGHEEGRLRTWLGDHLPGTGNDLRGVRPYRQLAVRGDATESILESVARFDGDLLVVGAQPRKTAAGGTTLGSTTERLMQSATIPVLVVPGP